MDGRVDGDTLAALAVTTGVPAPQWCADSSVLVDSSPKTAGRTADRVCDRVRYNRISVGTCGMLNFSDWWGERGASGDQRE